MMKSKPQLLSYDMPSGVMAFSTTRHGGVGQGPYSSFNINRYCGDEPAAVSANTEALADILGISPDHILMPHQIHEAAFRIVGPDFFSLQPSTRDMVLEGVDGIMTSVPGVCVGVSTADCIPVLLYDAVHHAVCAVHAGWRGTVQHITMKAVSEMRVAFGSDASMLRAVIGPGISLESFEVGQEVYEEFAQAGFDMDKVARFYDKWHIDLPECNRQQLIASGVMAENIQMAGIDTFTATDDFFSARKLGKDSGRIYTAIMIEQQT